MIRATMILLLLTLIPAAPLIGGQVDECLTTVSTSCSGMRLSICPAGDFEYIRYACGGSSDFILVTVRDSAGNPVPGIPRTDYWLQACDPDYELCLCCQPILADNITDIFGVTKFCGPIWGGGCVLDGGILLAVQGKVILTGPLCVNPTCIDIVIVSPDMNADCIVNLSDLACFGMTYNMCLGDPGYDPCGDFNDDWGSPTLKTIVGSGSTGLKCFADELPSDQRITYNKEPYRSMIDFILCAPGMAERYVKGSFAIRAGTVESSGSDHNPVLARFRVK